MVKKWRNFLGKIRKAASQYRKALKEEITSWRRTTFNIVVQVVIHLLRKSQGTSRPLRSSARGGPTALSFPLVLTYWHTDILRCSQSTSVFQPDQMTTKRRPRRWGWLFLSLFLLLSGLALTTFALVSWSLTSRPADRFLVLLDAGSVHTSVYTYRSESRDPPGGRPDYQL